MNPVGLMDKRDAAPLTVSHADLKRFGDGAYKSVCPVCDEGVLFIYRDERTLKLTNRDRCTYCAQVIFYTDKAINGEPVMDLRSS
jgi:predicted RNA-binding Zn-ribbon protein involved in translation (DUF1610 family)